MINGCGAADSFYPIKSLGTRYCKSCRKETEWAVMEVRRKVRVVFIPTVTLNKKYAVACCKCKTGYYISDAQKDFALSSPASCVEVKADGIEFHGITQAQPFYTPAPAAPQVQPSSAPAAPQAQQSPQQAQLIQTLKQVQLAQEVPQQRLCSCGAVLKPEDIYCPRCGMHR